MRKGQVLFLFRLKKKMVTLMDFITLLGVSVSSRYLENFITNELPAFSESKFFLVF